MDKYRRDDDMNDDLGAYNDQEDISGLSIVDQSGRGSPHQQTKVYGKTPEERELMKRVRKAAQKLSDKEALVMGLVVHKGLSISQAARRLGISQPRAQKCWDNIRRKLSNA